MYSVGATTSQSLKFAVNKSWHKRSALQLVIIRWSNGNDIREAEIRNAAHAANATVVQCEVIYFRILHNILVYTHVAWLLTTGCTVARGGVFQPWNTPSLA